MSTVSKTTTTLEKARLEFADGKSINEAPCNQNLKRIAEFADSLTAELQKENARLREALQWALARIPAPVKRTRENGEYCDAYEKAAALSKEKAK